MRLASKIIGVGKKSEEGFVLIVAIVAVMILMAVGFFALTIASKDILISVRVVGERKALIAAEAGINDICLTFAPTNGAIPDTQIDPAGDPTIYYSASAPVSDLNIPTLSATASSIEGGKSWSFNVYDIVVTGKDTNYGSSVSLAVGLRQGEVPSKPSYD